MGAWMAWISLLIPLTVVANVSAAPKNIAVIGEGVIGLSTALAIKKHDPDVKVTVFHDRPFESILSKNIAGLFRLDKSAPIHRLYGNETFVHLAKLWRTLGGLSGVQLLSGHIVSEDKNLLLEQEKAYADIVYNFRFLNDDEKMSQFSSQDIEDSSVIHFTAFTSEGGKYCPWMKKQLLERNVTFVLRKINTLDELGDEGYDVVVNCAGLNGGRLAGVPDDTFPIRGILLKVDAPWQKHFLFKNFSTFTIPTIDAVYVGTVKEANRTNLSLTDDERDSLWCRYVSLQPPFKNVKVLDHFVGLRPGRTDVRVEAETRTTPNGRTYKAVHNYGHGGSGFTLGWGTALHATALAFDLPTDNYDEAIQETAFLKEMTETKVEVTEEVKTRAAQAES